MQTDDDIVKVTNVAPVETDFPVDAEADLRNLNYLIGSYKVLRVALEEGATVNDAIEHIRFALEEVESHD